MASEKLLAIAGRYEIIRAIHTTFHDRKVDIDYAFNHRDAIYVLKQKSFTYIVIDAEMIDRHSGECTLHTVLQAAPGTLTLPIVLNPKAASNADGVSHDLHITTLEKVGLLKHIKINKQSRSLNTVPFKNPASLIEPELIEKLDPLFDLTKLLTEVLDLKEVLHRIVEVAMQLTNANESTILLPVEGELYLRARITEGMKKAKTYKVKSDDFVALQVFRDGTPKYSDTLPDQSAFFYLPILHQNKAIGILGVKDKNAPFADNYQPLLKHIASLAAIALHNANIHQKSLSRTNELETLIAMSDAVNKSSSLHDVLATVTQQISDAIQSSHTEILRWDDNNHLYTASRYYHISWFFGQGKTIDLSQSHITQSAIEQLNPLWLYHDDPSLNDTEEYNDLIQMKARAMLILPITANKQVVGVIRAFYLSPPDTPPSQKLLYQTLQTELHILRENLDNAAMTVPGSFYHIIKKINERLNANWSDLLLPIKSKSQLITFSRIGHGVWLTPRQPAIDITQYPDLDNLLNKKRPFIAALSDIRVDEWAKVFLNDTQLHSLLCLPLIRHNTVQGLIICGSASSNHTFSQNDIDLARAMAGQAAIAIENATLMHELQVSLDQLIMTQDQLVQAARLSAMGEMADVVAHQINNPLTTIIAEAELLLADEDDENSLHYSSLKAISHTGKRAASVVRGLLSISRSKNEKVTSIDLISSINNVISLLKSNFERTNIQLQINTSNTPIPNIVSSYGQLEDIWFNLLVNAQQALIGEAEGIIGVDITYTPNTNFVRVVVRDNGSGIPDDVLSQVFKPFFTTKSSGEATGLGLFICKQIIENIGGTIVIESEANIGTSVILNLPVQPI